jgi:hypothetical protein
MTVKPRGAGRPKGYRDDQARHLDELVTDLYLQLRLSSTQVGQLVGLPAAARNRGTAAASRREVPFMRRWRTTGREAGSMVRSG